MELLAGTSELRAGSRKDQNNTAEETTSNGTDDESNARPGIYDGRGAFSTDLESLLPELKRHLLCLLNLQQLRALVHASPSFHRQYLHDRKHILRNSLEQTLGSVIVDAYAVYSFAAQNPKPDRFVFLQWYSDVTKERRLPRIEDICEDAAIAMSAFFFRLAEPIFEHYSRVTLSNMVIELLSRSLHHRPKPTLSSTEAMRYRRAIYRFQLLCQLIDTTDWTVYRIHIRIAQEFLHVLEPWETEEVFTFYQYVEQARNDVVEEIRSDPRSLDPRANLDVGWLQKNHVEAAVLEGLSVLSVILFHGDDHELVVSTLKRHMTWVYLRLNHIGGLFGHMKQEDWCARDPSERDQMRDGMRRVRAPFPFRGDGEPDAPPLGWTVIWDGFYSNLYGWFIGQEMRDWGYVF
ncbi:hypothetical protein ACHAPT_010239 [Fusarium lateritium]